VYKQCLSGSDDPGRLLSDIPQGYEVWGSLIIENDLYVNSSMKSKLELKRKVSSFGQTHPSHWLKFIRCLN